VGDSSKFIADSSPFATLAVKIGLDVAVAGPLRGPGNGASTMQRKMLLLLAAVVAVVGLTIAGCSKAGTKGVQKVAREAVESKAVQDAREVYDSSKGVRQRINAKKIQNSANAIAEDY